MHMQSKTSLDTVSGNDADSESISPKLKSGKAGRLPREITKQVYGVVHKGNGGSIPMIVKNTPSSNYISPVSGLSKRNSMQKVSPQQYSSVNLNGHYSVAQSHQASNLSSARKNSKE